MNKARMLAASAGVAAAMVVLPTAGAFAHNCFNIDRNVNFVGPRGGWFGIDVNAEVPVDVANGLYSAEVGQCLLDTLPDKIAVKVKGTMGHNFVLLQNNPNVAVKSADGKGIETLDGIFQFCGAPA